VEQFSTEFAEASEYPDISGQLGVEHTANMVDEFLYTQQYRGSE